MRRISTKVAFPVLLGISAIIAVACGKENPGPGDDDSTDDSTDISDDGGGEPGSGGAGSSSGGTGNGSGGHKNNSGGSGDGHAGNGGEDGTGGTPPIVITRPDLPDCPDDANDTIDGGPIDGNACWDLTVCNGTASEQFLNKCSGNCIEPFDNFERIVGFNGTLPNL